MRSLLAGDRYNEKSSSRYLPNINVKDAIALEEKLMDRVMSLEEAILEKVKTLPLYRQQQVLDFVEP